MVAQQMNLDVISNNLANVNTTAFKGQRAEFQDLIYQTFSSSGAGSGANSQLPQATQVGLGSQFSASATSFSLGSLTNTGNPMDLAINGEGFFRVQLPSGDIGYTRDGSFKTDSNGLVVTSDGYQLEPGITIPNGATALTISKTGLVSAKLAGNDDPVEIGQITVSLFTNPAGLTRAGQNLFLAGGSSGEEIEVNPGADGAGSLQQSCLEGSNVSVVEEMVKMITAQRAYEINSKAIQTSDDMLSVLNSLKR